MKYCLFYLSNLWTYHQSLVIFMRGGDCACEVLLWISKGSFPLCVISPSLSPPFTLSYFRHRSNLCLLLLMTCTAAGTLSFLYVFWWTRVDILLGFFLTRLQLSRLGKTRLDTQIGTKKHLKRWDEFVSRVCACFLERSSVEVSKM